MVVLPIHFSKCLCSVFILPSYWTPRCLHELSVAWAGVEFVMSVDPQLPHTQLVSYKCWVEKDEDLLPFPHSCFWTRSGSVIQKKKHKWTEWDFTLLDKVTLLSEVRFPQVKNQCLSQKAVVRFKCMCESDQLRSGSQEDLTNNTFSVCPSWALICMGMMGKIVTIHFWIPMVSHVL